MTALGLIEWGRSILGSGSTPVTATNVDATVGRFYTPHAVPTFRDVHAVKELRR